MLRNTFRVEGPALISFSGGRTSAMMLKRIVDAHGGRLPPDLIPCFANTGKEAPETLDFVRACADRWGVPVTWLEFDPAGAKMRRFRVVDHAAASRRGEPFEAVIRERQYLPNPVTRFCTEMLKIRPMRDYALSLGWDEWSTVVGLRADEARRVARIRNISERWEKLCPLHDAGVTKADVTAFWAAQPFDLGLTNANGRTPAGNCDLCYLKSARTIAGLIAEDPARADWWVAMEEMPKCSKPNGSTFRIDRPSYAAMRQAVADQRAFDFGDWDELAKCFCHE